MERVTERYGARLLTLRVKCVSDTAIKMLQPCSMQRV